MFSRIRKLWWLAIPLVAGISFYAAKHATFRLKAYAQISTTPFVAETVSYSFKDNPQGELFFKKLMARRSDGSTAEVSRKGPIWGASVRSVTLMSGATFHAFDLVNLKTSWKRDPAELAALKQRLTNPSPDCLYRPDAKLVGRETLFGQELLVLQVMMNGVAVFDAKPSNFRETHWIAPQLGCESLQWRLEEQLPNGSYKLQTDERLISLEIKEPDPAFFDPSENYEEALPSEIIRRHYEKVGIPEPAESQKEGERKDKFVQDHKTNAR